MKASKESLREFWRDQLESVAHKKFLAGKAALSLNVASFIQQKFPSLQAIAAFRAREDRGEAGMEDLLAKASPYRWAFPVAQKDGGLDFYQAGTPINPKDFVKSAWGIWEPRATATKISDLELILVPLLAFDAQGTRLGQGKGFYDRLLAKCPEVPAIGIAFSWQESKDLLPREAHDKNLSAIITEQGLREFSCN